MVHRPNSCLSTEKQQLIRDLEKLFEIVTIPPHPEYFGAIIIDNLDATSHLSTTRKHLP
jgi:hypothetical protein